MRNRIIVILGKKGTGKTTLAKWYSLKSEKPVIIIDPQDQFSDLSLIFTDIYEASTFIADRWYELRAFGGRVVVQVSDEEDVQEFLTWAWERLKDYLLIIDEVDLFYNQWNWSHKNIIRKFIHYGRHKEADLITTSRRPANLPKDLLSQADVLEIFRMREPRDLNYLKQFIYAEDVEEKIRNLGFYEHIHYDANADRYETVILPKEEVRLVLT